MLSFAKAYREREAKESGPPDLPAPSAVSSRYNPGVMLRVFQIETPEHLAVARGWMFDHNPLMLERLREFLRERYGTVEKLREEYGDPTLTFETIQIPRDRLRESVPEVTQNLYWQPRRENAPIRDYLTHPQHHITHIAQAILATGLMILAAGSAFLGLLLHALNWRFIEVHEILGRGKS